MNDQQRAAMQMALYVMENCEYNESMNWDTICKAIAALREALAQPQEALEDIATYGQHISIGGKRVDPSDFYVAPEQPQGKWVDLTKHEIATLEKENTRITRFSYEGRGGGYNQVVFDKAAFALALIAKFKSKNAPPVVPQGEPVVCEHCKGTGLINNGECIFDCHYCNRIGK